jgi:hypothetical protein
MDLHPRASDQAAAHVPLPEITMSKSPVLGTNFHYLTDGTPLARRSLASGVGAVYRRVPKPRQPKKTAIFQEFSWRLWTKFFAAKPPQFQNAAL